MIIETWIAALLLIGICIIGGIGLMGWIFADYKLEQCRKENSALREKNRILQGKLIVKIANEFHNEGKKK